MMVSVGERISMSLLSMAIRDRGIEAISLTGSQSGIITTDTHGEADILEIKGERILKALDESKVVIVAGFQGVSRSKEITTLGRGGSDTTALALAVFLKAQRAYIYSDVDAYFSADPKQVSQARRYEQLSWEMAFLSSFYGAKVLHYRAAEIAAIGQLEIHLLSTFNPHGKAGVIRGSVKDNIESFQVLTLNLKKGLQKLTTKIHSGLDNKYLSELKSLVSPQNAAFQENSLPELSVYFGEKIEGHQEAFEKNFQEYWTITLVGTGLHSQKTLLERAQKLLNTHSCTLESHTQQPLFFSCTIKAAPEKEKELLEAFHQEFIG
jgi:aspartate kinase